MKTQSLCLLEGHEIPEAGLGRYTSMGCGIVCLLCNGHRAVQREGDGKGQQVNGTLIALFSGNLLK